MSKKVLWICNSMLPIIAKQLGEGINNKEGWISGVLNTFLQSKDIHKIQLGIAFPIPKDRESMDGRIAVNQDYDILYWGFRENVLKAEEYDLGMEQDLMYIIDKFKPDMIHCFGTEYPHTLAAIKVFQRKDRTLVGIQGLCSRCAKAYYANIPEKIWKRSTFRDFIRKDTVKMQRNKFEDRGNWEQLAIKATGHVTGRTSWDQMWSEVYNHNVKYHKMNETLRDEFYLEKWKYDTCTKHAIFLSQSDYPLKGAHYMLLALPKILNQYPDTMVYISGNSLLRGKGIKSLLKISSYGKYLEELLLELNIQNKVHFLGSLSAKEMRDMYLKSNVFVCPSSLENSPNSLGEAMLVGVPVVAAKVGGIPSMIDTTEGILYDGFREENLSDMDELNRISNELSISIIHVFEHMSDSILRAENARNRALKTHDKQVNHKKLLEIYEDICNGGWR